MKKLALLAALLVTTAGVAAAAPCDIKKISGTWRVHVVMVSSDEEGGFGPDTDQGNCWFAISRNSVRVANLRITCEPNAFFALGQTDFPELNPWHQLVRPNRARQQDVGGRSSPTPDRCEWTLVDQNGLDGEYTVNFSPDGQTLIGDGAGFLDLHFGRTEPFQLSFTGVRQ